MIDAHNLFLHYYNLNKKRDKNKNKTVSNSKYIPYYIKSTACIDMIKMAAK